MRYLFEREQPAERLKPATRPYAGCAASLRQELSQRNRKWVIDHACDCETSMGSIPSVLYHEDDAGNHSNFLPASYRAIQQSPEWARRLRKVHTSAKRAMLRGEEVSRRPGRSELDSSNSSDALLMNIFCHPETLARTRLLLGIDLDAEPVFGHKPRIPLYNGHRDSTEIDLKLGDLLIEAKLTEYDFQTAPRRLIERYQHLEEVFDVSLLDPNGIERASPGLAHAPNKVQSYQLIRGVLAAHASPRDRFCVLCDARRPDLIARWHSVLTAVKGHELRCRLLLLTWQELSAALSSDLRIFLRDKFGIGDGTAL